jgi:hypothetical protein
VLLRAGHAQHRGSADDFDPLVLRANLKLDLHALHRAQRDVDVRPHDLLKALLEGGQLVPAGREIAKRVLAIRTAHRGANRLVGQDVPEREGGFGHDRPRAVPDDAGDGSVGTLRDSKRRKQDEEGRNPEDRSARN